MQYQINKYDLTNECDPKVSPPTIPSDLNFYNFSLHWNGYSIYHKKCSKCGVTSYAILSNPYLLDLSPFFGFIPTNADSAYKYLDHAYYSENIRRNRNAIDTLGLSYQKIDRHHYDWSLSNIPYEYVSSQGKIEQTKRKLDNLLAWNKHRIAEERSNMEKGIIAEFLNTPFCPLCGEHAGMPEYESVPAVETYYSYPTVRHSSLTIFAPSRKESDSFFQRSRLFDEVLYVRGIKNQDAVKQRINEVLKRIDNKPLTPNEQKQLEEKVDLKVTEILEQCKKAVSYVASVNPPAFEPPARTLAQYLLHLLKTEHEITVLQPHIRNLYKEYYLSQPLSLGVEMIAKFETTAPLTAQLIQAQNLYEELSSRPDPSQSITPSSITIDFPQHPTPPSAPTLEKPGFFNKKTILARNAELTAEYEKRMLEYQKALDIYSAECAQLIQKRDRLLSEKREAATRALKQEKDASLAQINKLQAEINDAKQKSFSNSCAEFLELMESEINTAVKTLEELYVCRAKLYANNWLYGKYRKLSAISALYEYLTSGRCASFGGPNGAYNLYESELRAKIIIEKLDNIEQSLAQIKRNQALLYNELKLANSQLSTISGHLSTLSSTATASAAAIETSMKKLSATAEVIAYNTAATAYYARVNAQMTNALGFLIALK